MTTRPTNVPDFIEAVRATGLTKVQATAAVRAVLQHFREQVITSQHIDIPGVLRVRYRTAPPRPRRFFDGTTDPTQLVSPVHVLIMMSASLRRRAREQRALERGLE